MTEENSSGLSASEQAYFESGGTTEVVEADVTATQPVTETLDTAQIEQPEVTSQDRDDKGKFVPHGALHAEREEHKKTKAALEQISQRQAVLDDRWNTMLAAKATTEQPKQDETPPDPSVDVIGYMQFQAKKTQELNDKIASDNKQREEHTQAEQQERLIWDTWSSAVTQVKATAPDFDDAAAYLSQMRDTQLQAYAGVDPSFSNPQQRVAQINAELRSIIIAAKQQGQDPAVAVYQMAKGYGYAGGQPAANPQQETLDKIAKIDAAQRGSKTLTASNGSNSSDPLSAEAIADMSPKEFDAWMKDPANEKRFNTLMGG